jgi:hypothetical protein
LGRVGGRVAGWVGRSSQSMYLISKLVPFKQSCGVLGAS